jgi:hypothetical protein
MKTNCYDFAMKLACAKMITFYLTTHYTETNSERTDKYELDSPEWSFHEYDLIMCTAEKKNHFAVYGIREV